MTFATRTRAQPAHNVVEMNPPTARSSSSFRGHTANRRCAALVCLMLSTSFLAKPVLASEYLVFAKTVDSGVLLDGHCKEPFWKDIPPTVLSQGEGQLRIAFDGQFVTACVELVEAGLPSLDLWISTPALARSLRLHSSAQVGQAERKTIGWSDDIEWGRSDGWYAPPIPIQGMVVRGNLRRPLFSTVTQREIQLDTRRFGFGEWRFFLQISGVGSKRGQIRFPDADQSMPDQWATVKILPKKQ